MLEHNENYGEIARKIRIKILEMVFNSQTSHIGSAFSIVDILTVLYFNILSIDPRNPWAEDRDRFILSKGHAAAALYATLALRGFFHEDILNKYCINGGLLPGHSTKDCVPGVEASTGSLGHGLSMGIGMAIAGKFDKKDFRVFVLLSDGECNEGTVWEAAMFASHHRLDNLIAIVDYNGLQAFGPTKEVLDLEPFANKWISFGWECREIDGHDFLEIQDTLNIVPFSKNKPSIIIAKTIKGKGVSFMENKLAWHYKSPSKDQYKLALEELNLL